jgi:hypothetical protein
MEKFDLQEFSEGNNVTYIKLNDGDFVYIQIPKPENTGAKDLEEVRHNANRFFDWAFKDMNIRHSADLKFTIITKKEEFVARLNDDIVQL